MKSPAFQLFVRDWISSETINRLHRKNPTPISSFLFMLCHAWLSNPKATLPNDPEELAAAAHLTPDQFENMPELQKLFISDGNGRVFNERQFEGLQLSMTRMRAGKLGGNPRLVNQKDKQKVKQTLKGKGKGKGKH